MGRRLKASDTRAIRKVAKAPVVVVTPHPMAWREAKRISGGNVKVLSPQEDGSVIIRNN